MPLDEALRHETELGLAVIRDPEMMKGLGRYNSGDWSRDEFA